MIDSLLRELEKKEELYLRIKVFPSASENILKSFRVDNIEGVDVKTYLLDIKDEAIGGRANLALLKFFSKKLNIDMDDVSIVSGASSRIKLIKIIKR